MRIGDLPLVDLRRQSISCGDLAVFFQQLSARSALSNFCLEVDRFRDQLGSEISENAAERITCHAQCKSQATMRLLYILQHS